MPGEGRKKVGRSPAAFRLLLLVFLFGLHPFFTHSSPALLHFLNPLPAGAEIIDRIVAVVNDEIITDREMQEKAYPILLQMAGTPTAEEVAQIRKNVLTELVKNRLVVQAAKQKRIVLDRDDVEAFVRSRVDALQKQYAGEFENVLAEQGYTFPEFENLMRREAKQELIKSRLISDAVEGAVVVTDDDIRVQYTTRMLLARTADEALKALLQVKSGKTSFAGAVRQFSVGTNLEEGGEMGSYLLGKWSEEIEAEVIRLRNPGDLTGVIPTQAGYAVVQLVSRRLGSIEDISQTDRKKISDRLRRLKSYAESNAYVSSLWDKAYVKIID